MNLNEFIESALNMEQRLLVEAVEDLTPEELTWQPGADANPMGWMLWHTIRVEDMWIQFFIQRQVEIWERDGWHEKFGLPTRDNGFGHTPEQVAGFPALDMQELLRYGEAVRAGTLEHLRGLSPEDFDHVPREQRPNLSVGGVYRQLLGEFFQHQGQIAYLKGLKRGSGALPPTYATPG
ncbi:MAG: DinB family protein [Chloroflexota bacterium]|nr:DinB family protein [Chloroflexota bacterium]